MAPRVEASGDVFDLARPEPCRLGSSPYGVGARRWSSGSTGSRSPLGNSERLEDLVLGLASATVGRAGVGQDDAAVGLLAEARVLPRLPQQPGSPPCSRRWCVPLWRSAIPNSLSGCLSGLDPAPPRRARPRRSQRRPHRGPRGPPGSRRCLRQRRRSLGAVRGRPRAGVRAPRPGPLLAWALPTTDAVPVLQRARGIFERLRAALALAETDALLGLATRLSS